MKSDLMRQIYETQQRIIKSKEIAISELVANVHSRNWLTRPIQDLRPLYSALLDDQLERLNVKMSASKKRRIVHVLIQRIVPKLQKAETIPFVLIIPGQARERRLKNWLRAPLKITVITPAQSYFVCGITFSEGYIPPFMLADDSMTIRELATLKYHIPDLFENGSVYCAAASYQTTSIGPGATLMTCIHNGGSTVANSDFGNKELKITTCFDRIAIM